MDTQEAKLETGNAKIEELLPLDAAERIVTWRGPAAPGTQTIIRHVFRRITVDDCRKFFSEVIIEMDRESRTIDSTIAALNLYERAIVRAEGYVVRGGAPLESLEQWKQRVPRGHRLKAVELLIDVRVSAENSGAEIDPMADIVALDAFWGQGDEAGPGRVTMREYRGLVHRFAPPTADDQHRFSRAISKSLVVGGSRAGKTIFPSKEKILLDLYDRLVLSVEGYGRGGEPVTADAATFMDPFHKICAVGQLFVPATEAEEESEA